MASCKTVTQATQAVPFWLTMKRSVVTLGKEKGSALVASKSLWSNYYPVSHAVKEFNSFTMHLL